MIDGLWYVTYKKNDDTELLFDFDGDIPQVEKVTFLSFDE